MPQKISGLILIGCIVCCIWYFAAGEATPKPKQQTAPAITREGVIGTWRAAQKITSFGSEVEYRLSVTFAANGNFEQQIQIVSRDGQIVPGNSWKSSGTWAISDDDLVIAPEVEPSVKVGKQIKCGAILDGHTIMFIPAGTDEEIVPGNQLERDESQQTSE